MKCPMCGTRYSKHQNQSLLNKAMVQRARQELGCRICNSCAAYYTIVHANIVNAAQAQILSNMQSENPGLIR